jgi:hypothetical protein
MSGDAIGKFLDCLKEATLLFLRHITLLFYMLKGLHWVNPFPNAVRAPEEFAYAEAGFGCNLSFR